MSSAYDNLMDEVRKECLSFNIACEDDSIVHKMCALCNEHILTAEELVSTWLAFVASKRLGATKPTIDLLDQMAVKEEQRRKEASTHSSKDANLRFLSQETKRNRPISQEDALDLMEAYVSPCMKGKMPKHQLTPENTAAKRFVTNNRSPAIPFSPTSYSPIGKHSPGSKYNSRKNAGEVMLQHGDTSKAKWKGSRTQQCMIQHYEEAFALVKPYRYLYEKLKDVLKVRSNWLEDMAKQMEKAFNISVSSDAQSLSSDTATVIGTVVCDGIGKLNANSILLETNWSEDRIPVNVSALEEYAFFPGQVVALDGKQFQGMLAAQKAHLGVVLPLPENKAKIKDTEESLQIVVAAGPYTTADEGNYEPLADLLTYVQKNAVDLLILVGPFVDENQDLISVMKNLKLDSENEIITYEDVFNSVVELVVGKLENTSTQVVLVPSLRDNNNFHCVYPTAPFTNPPAQNVHYMPDPCVLDVNGIVIGATSVDILFQLGKEEISYPPGSSDRLSRLVRHLLLQQSFYPMNPPSEGVNIDTVHLEMHGRLPVTPHLLILPSDLKYFIKVVEGCLCINPERLTKGVVGGTFARMQIDPTETNSSVVGTALAEIVKI